MVKINKTLGLALLTALAASCSSDNDVVQSNNPVIENGEAAYATLRIDLPTQPSSPTGRAVEFNDGEKSEYEVKDATLLVFKKAGDAERSYTFVENVPLNNLTWKPQNYDGVTTGATVTAQLTQANLTDAKKGEYYALVILNNGTSTAQKITLPTKDQTFSNWNNDASKVNATNMLATSTNGFVMANAPEWKTAGVTPLTLVPIDGTKVRTTAAEATKAGVAADIHVERGLAKVTIADASKTPNISGSAHTGDAVSISGWTLDVTNRKSFPVHNVDGLTDDYSAIWNEVEANADVPNVNRFHDMTNTFKRVYWGKDPNYDLGDPYISGEGALAKCAEEFKMVATQENPSFSTDFGDKKPQYCLENTFNIKNMYQGQTTRVVFKATYTPSGMTSDKTFFKVGNTMYTEDGLKAYIQKVVKELTGIESTKYTLNLGDILTKPGTRTLPDNAFTAAETDGKVPEDDALTKVKNQIGSIDTYLNGVCYYIGRIKHFGDEDTPWGMVGTKDYGSDTYGGANDKYLGRYGVLRNNWYNLSVSSVAGPGTPVVPPVVPNIPDDEKDVYVNLTVKILQWAKHTTQSLSDL